MGFDLAVTSDALTAVYLAVLMVSEVVAWKAVWTAALRVAKKDV